jgi:adenosylcobinamide-phosphate synthase
VAPLTRRHLDSLDLHGVVRVAIEAGARLLDQRVVAPLFWYALLGLPGAFVWTAADALDEAIGHPDPRHAQFGAAAAHLDDALNFLPARLSAALLTLAALFVPGAAARRAWATVRTGARLHPSRNGGWPVAAVAGALDLSLAGPRRQGDTVAREPWIGAGRARAMPTDLRRARVLIAVAGLLAAGLVVVLGLLTAF